MTSQSISKESFLALVGRRLARNPGVKNVQPVPDAFAILFEPQGDAGQAQVFSQARLNLDGMYRDAQGRDDLTGFIDDYLERTVVSGMLKTRLKKSDLLPAIRTQTELSISRLLSGQLPEEHAALDRVETKPLAGPFAVVMIQDLPSSTALVLGKYLEEVAGTIQDALPIGMANLRKISKPKFEEVAPGVHVSCWHDFNDCSRVLIDSMFTTLKLSGAPVVMLPDRNTMLVASSNDAAAIEMMVDMASHVLFTSRRPQAAIPIVFRNGSWKVYEATGRAAEVVAENARALQILDYAAQERHLVETLKTRGMDRHVATLIPAVRFPSGIEGSDTTGGKLRRSILGTEWLEGQDTYLPMVDLLRITRPAGERLVVDFSKALAELPQRFVPAGLAPQRFRVKGTLDDDEIQRLSQCTPAIPHFPWPESILQ